MNHEEHEEHEENQQCGQEALCSDRFSTSFVAFVYFVVPKGSLGNCFDANELS